MPISNRAHLEKNANRCLLIVLGKSQLDESDVTEKLAFYGTVKKVQLTPDHLTAFVDFNCPHSPLLVAKCFVYFKAGVEVMLWNYNKKMGVLPMPEGVDKILAGCSMNNYLYLHHVPRDASTFVLQKYFSQELAGLEVKILKPDQSSRVVVEVKGQNKKMTAYFFLGEMKFCEVNYTRIPYLRNGIKFYAVPYLPELADTSLINGGCDQCNVSLLEKQFVQMANESKRKQVDSDTVLLDTVDSQRVSLSCDDDNYDSTSGESWDTIDGITSGTLVDYDDWDEEDKIKYGYKQRSVPCTINKEQQEEKDVSSTCEFPIQAIMKSDWDRKANDVTEMTIEGRKKEKDDEAHQLPDLISSTEQTLLLNSSIDTIYQEEEGTEEKEENMLSDEEGKDEEKISQLGEHEITEQVLEGEQKVYSSTPFPRWTRMRMVDQDEEEEGYRFSEYISWLTREEGTSRRDSSCNVSSDSDLVPLLSSLASISWGPGIVIEEKTTFLAYINKLMDESLNILRDLERGLDLL